MCSPRKRYSLGVRRSGSRFQIQYLDSITNLTSSPVIWLCVVDWMLVLPPNSSVETPCNDISKSVMRAEAAWMGQWTYKQDSGGLPWPHTPCMGEDDILNQMVGSHQILNISSSWSGTSQPPELWKTPAYCLSHPVYGNFVTAAHMD